MASAVTQPAGKDEASLDGKQKGRANEAFKLMDMDGRGKLYSEELEAVFSGASILENAVLGGAAEQAAAELRHHFPQNSGITEEDWEHYLRIQKSSLGPHQFKKFLEDIAKHAAKPDTRDKLKLLKSTRMARQQADRKAEVAQARKWTDQTARRIRPDACEPSSTGLQLNSASGEQAADVELILHPSKKQPPLTTEDRIVAEQYVKYSAQRAKREQEDEQDAMELLQTRSSRGGSASGAGSQEQGESANGQPTVGETPGRADNSRAGPGLARLDIAGAECKDAELPPLRLYLMQPPECECPADFAWQPPTADIDCVEAVVYLQFCRRLVPSLSFDVSMCANEYVAPNRSLPSLLIKEEQILVPRQETMEAIKRLLVKPCVREGCTPQFEGATANEPGRLLLNDALSDRAAELEPFERAISALVEGSLRPLVLHLRWVDDGAAAQEQLAYARGLPFAQRLVLGRQHRARVLDQLTSLEARDTTQVLTKAERALQALTTMLSTTDFFYGSEPTAIDAKVFAHLLPLMRESPGSLSHPELTRSSWPQLFEYVQRCCKLLREVEDTFIDLEGLCPVERRSLPEQSQWVSDMVTASDAEARKTEVKFTGWFDYFKMMSPLIVAGSAFAGFVMLRRIR